MGNFFVATACKILGLSTPESRKILWRRVAIFAIDFSGRPTRKISKNHATAYAFGCPDSSCFARFDPTRGRNIATQWLDAVSSSLHFHYAKAPWKHMPLYLDSDPLKSQNPRLIIGRMAEEVAHALRFKACFVDWTPRYPHSLA